MHIVTANGEHDGNEGGFPIGRHDFDGRSPTENCRSEAVAIVTDVENEDNYSGSFTEEEKESREESF